MLVKDEQKWEKKAIGARVVGKILKVSQDVEHYRIIYILSESNGIVRLWSFTEDSLFELTTYVDDL